RRAAHVAREMPEEARPRRRGPAAEGGHVELYNLRDDPYEQRDLATSQPARAKSLTQTLHAWQRDTRAAIPSEANPAYDPHADRPRGGQREKEDQRRKGGRDRRKAR
ncbi:MAG: hypothetical protein ACKOK8_01550, partial [Planctomycetia bacterium]